MRLCTKLGRFKDLLNLCPHYGYESWCIVSYFYEGLTNRESQFVEMMCNREFLQKDLDEAIEYLNDLAEKPTLGLDPIVLRIPIGLDQMPPLFLVWNLPIERGK